MTFDNNEIKAIKKLNRIISKMIDNYEIDDGFNFEIYLVKYNNSWEITERIPIYKPIYNKCEFCGSESNFNFRSLERSHIYACPTCYGRYINELNKNK